MKGIRKFGFLAAMVLGNAIIAKAQLAERSIDTTRTTPASPGVSPLTTATKTDTAKAKPLAVKKPIVKKPKPIRTELSGGLRLNTDGWGLFMDKGWVKSEEKDRDNFYDIRLLQVEIDEKKNPREFKRSNNSGGGDAKPYIFGKVNNFYTFKIGYGFRKMIAGKPEPGNVSIHWVYLGGISLGLLKPYYLQTTEGEIKFSDSTAKTFLNPLPTPTTAGIIGGAGFAKGLGETKIVPGIHAKTGLHFDFAATKTQKLAVETGVNAELYTKKIEIMANKDAVPFFINVYASVQFGKRKQ